MIIFVIRPKKKDKLQKKVDDPTQNGKDVKIDNTHDLNGKDVNEVIFGLNKNSNKSLNTSMHNHNGVM